MKTQLILNKLKITLVLSLILMISGVISVKAIANNSASTLKESCLHDKINTQDNRLAFSYKITPNAGDSKRYSIAAEIKNTSSNSFFFMSESCNELDYYLKTDRSEASIEILMHCNASFPKKNEIPAHSSFKFNSKFRINGNCNELRFLLTLIELDEKTNVNDKRISEIKDKFSANIITLSGPVISLP